MTVIEIVNQLERTIGIDGHPRRILDALEYDLRIHFGLPAIQAAERADRLTAPVSRTIAERAQRQESSGLVARLVLVGASGDSVAGSCWVMPTDGAAMVAAKKQRRHVEALHGAMRDLNFNDFEAFGSRVLQELGAGYSKVTKQSGDQGIDFYGSLSLGSLQGLPIPFFKMAHDTVVYFAGQAKHYPDNSIGPSVVRELIGSISLARTKTYSALNLELFEGMEIKPFSPLIAFLFTTGRLSSGAVQLADAAGIIARSGPQLAAFLADRGVGMDDAAGEPTFSSSKFQEWLERQ